MRAGLPASDVRGGGPVGESGAAGGVKAGSLVDAPAGSPAPPAVKAVEGGGLGFGEFTPLRSPPWGVEKLGSVNMQPLNILIVAPGKR